ncbi:poly-beta-1,6-N-acetyl-D-glucosamine synthase [Sporomusa sphaeroides]|uniref:poly-beta-1,6-N-acetyl-D-glucosamine synthase n=1 Tax=Sporomusa sphaeroides TaxID=47679 RepID=UPI0031583871
METYSWLELVENYVFYYPLAMSIVWMIGASYFYLRRERGEKQVPELKEYPLVSVLIPARNEEDAIRSTIEAVLSSQYPNFEIIVLDDASTDSTAAIVQEIEANEERVRVLLLNENVGKPSALRYGTLASRGDILLCIDADAYLDPWAMHWMVSHFNGPRVGAVTGNPRVRNRTSLLAKIQVGEYSSIIGMIKRTQRILGKVLTVSGVIVAFRKQAIFDAGLWDADMITDDINITWKLEKRFWDIRYEPNALCWILVPETVSGLWRQRVRWAQGGVEVVRRHRDIWKSWKQRRLWPVYLEYVLSIIWSYVFVLLGIVGLVNLTYPTGLPEVRIFPEWKGSMLAFICLLQFLIGLTIDQKYEKSIPGYLFWVIWYPFAYWLLTAFATVYAAPRALFRKMGQPAVWTSPDRGIFTKL